MREWKRVFLAGFSLENPLTVLLIGLCATLAVSTRFEGALFMGFAVIFVLVMSNVIISALRRFIPHEVRIPIFIVVIASFVTIVDLSMKAFLPAIYAFLGVWVPLIVVNCIVLGRAEAYAYKQPVLLSVADGLGMGLGFTIVISLLAASRELIGAGHIVFLGRQLVALPEWYAGPSIVVLFPGAFLVFGFIIAAQQAVNRRLSRRTGAPAPVPGGTGCGGCTACMK